MQTTNGEEVTRNIGPDDMYRAILKEIGCEESNMEYLFDRDDDDEDDDDDDVDSEDYDEEGGRAGGTAALPIRGELSVHQGESDRLRLQLHDSTSDEELLHEWEADVHDAGVNASDGESDNDMDADENCRLANGGNEIVEKGKTASPTPILSSDDEGGGETNRLPEWKELLIKANVQQQQLQQQLKKLQRSQKESSPSQRQDHKTRHQSKIPSLASPSPRRPLEVDMSTPSSVLGATQQSTLLLHLSARDSQLQQEWQSQQAETTELQTKLSTLQHKFYDQQNQWEQEQQVLFSPTRKSGGDKNIINGSSDKNSKSLLNGYTSQMQAPGSSLPLTTHTARNGRNDSSANWFSLESSPLLTMQNQQQEEKDRKIQQLEALVQELQTLQESKTQELHEYKDRLSKRDLEHHNLLVRYEEEKKHWEDSKQATQIQHDREQQSCKRDLEEAKDTLQQQVSLNQDLREALQDTKSNSWKAEVDETQNQIRMAIQQQTQKTHEFQSRIQYLEDKREEERRLWEGKLQDYQRQLEDNTAEWEHQIKAANDRYEALEEMYTRETNEWQQLLELEMTKALDNGELDEPFKTGEGQIVSMVPSMASATEREGDSHDLHQDFGLSPIPQAASTRMIDNESSMENSSVDEDKSAASQSMEMIDGLLEELGRMHQERTDMLEEMNGKGEETNNEVLDGYKDSTNTTSQQKVLVQETDQQILQMMEDMDDDGIPKPLDSAPSSPTQGAQDGQKELDATNDSTILNQTLSLLTNLKDLITFPGNKIENETTVLENLEVLSDLMHDHSNYQSLVLSPKRRTTKDWEEVEKEENQSTDLEHEQSHIVDTSKGERDISWIASAGKAAAATDPWPELVAELKSRCNFLERDREDLTRITERILEMERGSHKVELEAAAATAKREAKEALYDYQQLVNRHMRGIYRSLCIHCKKGMYGTM